MNPRTAAVDGAPTLDFLREMNAEDRLVAAAVGERPEEEARAVDGTADRLRDGGRVHYFGAGTSGRLAVLDAVECPPTFASPPTAWCRTSSAASTRSPRPPSRPRTTRRRGARNAEAASLGPAEAAVGVTASGRTPYVMGTLGVARRRGAFAVAITGAPGSPAGAAADVAIEVVTGAEVVAGSTRLKASSPTTGWLVVCRSRNWIVAYDAGSSRTTASVAG